MQVFALCRRASVPVRRESHHHHISRNAVGTHLEIEFFGEQVGATVVQSPLWDPKGERIRV
jgi:hypothetical protein